ncbi:MAG: hypothetical protein A2848_01380 [Candidatus Magasanikbacteria bacterium RIFCSPHIGHO2_01_FULL_50_8]|uniref:Uncharacterized protein n=2 Tax=Candidatus Magasanikiibacteriota TaxID=1752731 RepID=A0A1F6LRT9_9BACT|nr:MAG: hypothetical protein A2848_01380 [Candidatus Magasanikbacteria bacterium RIFCSPHIGHO2_01_FULL_50_8]OGH67835.1 MAG: hypothetical protein A3C15_02135 [Candidatus Magasanikbacteria bacterium RIFCSPHIGHO2_02_FULL_50_9b]
MVVEILIYSYDDNKRHAVEGGAELAFGPFESENLAKQWLHQHGFRSKWGHLNFYMRLKDEPGKMDLAAQIRLLSLTPPSGFYPW